MKRGHFLCGAAGLAIAVTLTGCANPAPTDPQSTEGRAWTLWNEMSDIGRDLACSGDPALSGRSLAELTYTANEQSELPESAKGLTQTEFERVAVLALTTYC